MPIVTVLMFGDVVGKPGRSALRQTLPALKEKYDPDFIVANGENIASGSGITLPLAQKLFGYGIQAVTSGDHIFRNKEFPLIIDNPKILRPVNYPKSAAGRGWNVYEARGGVQIAVVNVMGRIFMEPHDCPFNAMDNALREIAEKHPGLKVIVVDMHAEATSEKVGMGWYLDGRVSAVVGTHTHVQTVDERILPMGTAHLSDLGMTGPYDGIIGREKVPVLHKLTTGMPAKFDVAEQNLKACGAAIKIQSETGKALSIERIQAQAGSSNED